MKPPWGVWFWSLGSTHHGTFRDPVDAQQEQGSLDQRHPPRDALGLAAQQAIQAAGAAGNGSGAGFQLQDVRALVSLEDVDVWHDVFKLGIVILFGCTFPPTFVHVCAITRELCSLQPDGDSFAHRKWQESIPPKIPEEGLEMKSARSKLQLVFSNVWFTLGWFDMTERPFPSHPSVSPRKKKPNWNWRNAWGICLQHSWDLELLTQLERGGL